MRGSFRVVAYQSRKSPRKEGTQSLGVMAWTSMRIVARMCEEKNPRRAMRGIPSIAFIVMDEKR
jgi:hypothetical protein